MNWQTIETAPNDGKTWVLVYSQEQVGYRESAWPARMCEPKFMAGHDRPLAIGIGNDGEQYGWHPTHWMPFPKPPEDTAHG